MGKISLEDRCLIKNLRSEKNWGARKMKNEFPRKCWKLSSLSKLIKKIDSTGNVIRQKGSGRPSTIRTPNNILVVQHLIINHGNVAEERKSPRKIQNETGISRSSVIRIIRQDLHLKVYKRVQVQLLTETNKEKRLLCATRLLDRFSSDRLVRRIWFSDEKLFSVSAPLNKQNDRVYSTATKKSEVPSEQILFQHSHFSKSVMVSVAVSKMGKSQIVFIEPGAKINSEYYCQEVLAHGLLLDIRQRCGHYNWTLQQDGAPSHRAAKTVEFLRAEGVNFIEPDLWPPNSPDLNPVDYAIWGALEERVYIHKPRNIEELRQAIIEEWGKLSQRIIIRSIDQWRIRLIKVVELNGGHIEHLSFK
jgi:hypothetical protein